MSRGYYYDDYVKCAVEGGADLIVSGAGLPMDLPGLVEGTNVKIAPIVSSAKAAKVLLNVWARHHKRTADLVVIEGPKAGGHLGYTREQVAEHENDGYEKRSSRSSPSSIPLKKNSSARSPSYSAAASSTGKTLSTTSLSASPACRWRPASWRPGNATPRRPSRKCT